jgi:hypothetical protein
MRRMAEMTRSSCFLSRISMVISTTAPSLLRAIVGTRFETSDVRVFVREDRGELIEDAGAVFTKAVAIPVLKSTFQNC